MLKKLCQYSGCNEMAEPGHTYCAKHLVESQKKHKEWLQNHNKKKPFENAVRTNNYNNAEWRNLRREVLERDNYQCCQCGITKEESGYPLEIHHIIPVAQWGGNDINNLMLLCQDCHKIIDKESFEKNKKQRK